MVTWNRFISETCFRFFRVGAGQPQSRHDLASHRVNAVLRTQCDRPWVRSSLCGWWGHRPSLALCRPWGSIGLLLPRDSSASSQGFFSASVVCPRRYAGQPQPGTPWDPVPTARSRSQFPLSLSPSCVSVGSWPSAACCPTSRNFYFLYFA